VSLGDDAIDVLPPNARCATSPRIDGDVRVTNQTELEALAGCEEISGDLAIEVSSAARSPLVLRNPPLMRSRCPR
jgi:hypothetical protein